MGAVFICKRLLVTIATSGVIVIASCSTHAPEIQQLSFQLVFQSTPGSDRIQERLSVFTHIVDLDGTDEVSDLIVVHDESELSWTADSSRWVRREEGGNVWVGASRLTMPADARFPRGAYRVVIQDLSGRRAEDSFFLPFGRQEQVIDLIPTLRRQDGNMLVEATGSDTYLVGVDRTGAPARHLIVEPGVQGQQFEQTLRENLEWYLVSRRDPFAYVFGPVAE